MPSTLSLGHVDASTQMTEEDFINFLKTYNYEPVVNAAEERRLVNEEYSDKTATRWISYRLLENNVVAELTQFLQAAGFFPHAENDGIFGYATQASVRLFQEYVRTQEGYTGPLPLPTPDGIVGPNTHAHIKRWKSMAILPKVSWQGIGEDSYITAGWRRKFNQLKSVLEASPNRVKDHINAYQKESDTLKVEDWMFPESGPLLFGIRRGAGESPTKSNRPNDDIFILLLNGLTFCFFGSTDPAINVTDATEAYLLEGQHLYRYSWHKISQSWKTYRALRPADKGVLIYRDTEEYKDNALTDRVLANGAWGTGRDINIHWSGKGTWNFSNGCQVIAGGAYIDQNDRLISCKKFAASRYRDLGNLHGKGYMTKGAYNLLADLLLIYGTKGSEGNPPVIRYTLVSEDTLAKADVMSLEEVDMLRRTFPYYSK